MDRRQLIIISGIIVLGLLLAFPLTWVFTDQGGSSRAVRVAVSEGAIRRTDAGGTEWMITPVVARPAAVDPNAAQAKPAIVVKTEVFRASDREMLIGLIVADRSGQRYHPSVVKGGKRLPAPKLRIVNEAGQVMVDDSFAYG